MLHIFLDMQVACTEHLVSCNNDDSFSSFLKQHKVLNSSSVENFDSCKQTSSDSLSFLQQSVYYTNPVQDCGIFACTCSKQVSILVNLVVNFHDEAL